MPGMAEVLFSSIWQASKKRFDEDAAWCSGTGTHYIKLFFFSVSFSLSLWFFDSLFMAWLLWWDLLGEISQRKLPMPLRILRLVRSSQLWICKLAANLQDPHGSPDQRGEGAVGCVKVSAQIILQTSGQIFAPAAVKNAPLELAAMFVLACIRVLHSASVFLPPSS